MDGSGQMDYLASPEGMRMLILAKVPDWEEPAAHSCPYKRLTGVTDVVGTERIYCWFEDMIFAQVASVSRTELKDGTMAANDGYYWSFSLKVDDEGVFNLEKDYGEAEGDEEEMGI